MNILSNKDLTDEDLRSFAVINTNNLKFNLNNLISQYGNRNKLQENISVIAMVKANAYGHGLLEVSKSIQNLDKVSGFGVATLEEAISLRENGISKQIWVVSGSSPLTKNISDLAQKLDLELFIHNAEDLKSLVKLSDRARKLKFQFKFNTGMNRLGINFNEAQDLLLKIRKAGLKPTGVCTHFAMAQGMNPITNRQIAEFKGIAKFFRSIGVRNIHSANSAAIIQDRKLKTSDFCNIMRPGIAMYGYAGFSQNSVKLKPALELNAKIILSRKVKKGESVGYDCTYKVGGSKQTSHLSQLVLSHGYADGFLRSLSNKEIKIALAGSHKLIKTEVLGRVSMDITSIRGNRNSSEKQGSFIKILGVNEEQGMHMASQAGTNIYEILTSISPTRVKRVIKNAMD